MLLIFAETEHHILLLHNDDLYSIGTSQIKSSFIWKV